MWMQKRRVFAEKHGASGPGGPQIDGVSTHPNQLVCFILENLSIPVSSRPVQVRRLPVVGLGAGASRTAVRMFRRRPGGRMARVWQAFLM